MGEKKWLLVVAVWLGGPFLSVFLCTNKLIPIVVICSFQHQSMQSQSRWSRRWVMGYPLDKQPNCKLHKHPPRSTPATKHFMNSVSIHRTLYNHVCPMKAPTNATPRGSDVSDVFFMCLRVYRQQCHNPFIMVQFSGLIINLQLRKNNYFQVIYFYIAFQRICLYFHNTKLS